MFPEEYIESLCNQYCRTPHYVDKNILTDKDFSVKVNSNNLELLWEKKSSRKEISIYIQCESTTMRIIQFDCSCVNCFYNSNHLSACKTATVSQYDKKAFRIAFLQYVSKNPSSLCIESFKLPKKQELQSPSSTQNCVNDDIRIASAKENIHKWISGETVYIPELITAMQVILNSSPDLAHTCIDYIKNSSEIENKDWPLFANFIVSIYIKVSEYRNNPDLKIILTKARTYQQYLNCYNPWKYRLTYNPLEQLIDTLSFLDNEHDKNH